MRRYTDEELKALPEKVRKNREYYRMWYAANKERLAKNRNARNAQRREDANAYVRQWRSSHRERWKEIRREHYHRHKEEISQRRREKRLLHREEANAKQRQYRRRRKLLEASRPRYSAPSITVRRRLSKEEVEWRKMEEAASKARRKRLIREARKSGDNGGTSLKTFPAQSVDVCCKTCLHYDSHGFFCCHRRIFTAPNRCCGNFMTNN